MAGDPQAPSSCPHPSQLHAGLLAELTPRVLALLGEVRPQTRWLLDGVPDPAPAELGHGEIPPRVGADPSQLRVTRAKQELVEEPVDGIDVIAPPRDQFLPERRVLDQRPDRPTGDKLVRDAAKQIVDLRRRITPGVPPGQLLRK